MDETSNALALAAIMADHRRLPGDECSGDNYHCGHMWPCPTYRLAELAQEQAAALAETKRRLIDTEWSNDPDDRIRVALLHLEAALEGKSCAALAGEYPNPEPKTLPKYEERGMARPSDEPWQPGAKVCPCGCPTRSAHLRMIGVK